MLGTLKKKLNLQRGVIIEFWKDMMSFRRHNGASSNVSVGQVADEFKLAIFAHAVEKGLCQPDRRAFFGFEKIERALQIYRRLEKPDVFSARMFDSALRGYIAAHATEKEKPEFFGKIVAHQDSNALVEVAGEPGTVAVAASERDQGFIESLKRRRSCRLFDGMPLDRSVVASVIALASRAPSQCNRQTVRVHIYKDRKRIQGLLALQCGASGFSETVGNLFVVSFDQAGWLGAGQRNQGYVDGGIFAQSFMLALDAHGIQSCPLNLATTNEVETAIKRLGSIPDRERLVLFIAAGHTPGPTFIAAASPRRDISELVTYHDAED